MDLRNTDAFSVAAGLFIFAALTVFTGSAPSYGESVFIQAAGALLWLPFFLASGLASSFSLVAPLAFIAFLLYVGIVRGAFGESALSAGVFAAIVLFLGV